MAVNFTEDAAKRIAAAVRKVEGQPTPGVGDARRPTSGPDAWFWARLTAYADGLYSFTRMDPAEGELADSAFAGERAIDVNAGPELAADTIVRLQFAGYDGEGNARYLFAAPTPGGDGWTRVADLLIKLTAAPSGGYRAFASAEIPVAASHEYRFCYATWECEPLPHIGGGEADRSGVFNWFEVLPTGPTLLANGQVWLGAEYDEDIWIGRRWESGFTLEVLTVTSTKWLHLIVDTRPVNPEVKEAADITITE